MKIKPFGDSSSSADIIDVHSHFYPKPFLQVLESHGLLTTHANKKRYGILYIKETPQVRGRAIKIRREMWDLNLRIKIMKRLGIRFSFLSIGNPWLNLIPKSDSKKSARIINRALHDIIKVHPESFAAIGTLPLNDPPEISGEMEFAVDELGIKGFMVPTQVNGKCIASEEFFSIFKECSKLHVPLYIHPWVGFGLSQLYKKEDITAIIFPAEIAVTALRIYTSGLVDRYPNLRVILSHLGGNLPYVLGRIEREIEPGSARKILQTTTVRHLKRFLFDSICYNSLAFEFAVDTWGADKILFGTDSPFVWSDSSKRTVGIVDNSGIDRKEKRMIFNENAVNVFSLDR